MKTFRYTTLVRPSATSLNNELELMGDVGWRLVSVVRDGEHCWVAFLEREITG